MDDLFYSYSLLTSADANASDRECNDGMMHDGDPTYHLRLHQKLQVPGVFDLKWSPTSSQTRLLGASLADGTLRCYNHLGNVVEDGNDIGSSSGVASEGMILSEKTRCQCFPDFGGMALSLDWREE